MQANNEMIKRNISMTELEQENKQLKEEIEKIKDELGNELQVKYLEVELLKEELIKEK